MACNYFFKGVLIGDEFLLNDFLIKNRDLLESGQSDLVFQKSEKQHKSEKVLFEHIKDNKKRTDKIKRDHNTVDGEVDDKVEKPYIGVTEFLNSFKAWDDSPLFPIFIDENYWFNKMNQWKDGLFADEEELVLLGTKLDDPTLETSITLNGNIYVKGKPITDKNVLNAAQKLLIEKWKVLNLAGIDVHEVLRYYFSRENNQMRGELGIESLVKQITKKKLVPNLSEESVRQVLLICEHLKTTLRELFPDCSFWPEFTISTQLDDGRSILGRIDLVVVDNEGIPHIIDFKTSPKSYNDFNRAKVRTFYYQTAVYNRMLRMLGLNTDRATVSILPIQFTNFRRENEKFVWDKIQVTESENSPLLVDITSEIYDEDIQYRIDEFMPYKNFLEVEPGEVTKNVKDQMSKWCPDFSEQVTEDSEIQNSDEFFDKVKEQIMPYLSRNKETGYWIYKNDNAHGETIMGKDETEVIKKYIKQLSLRKQFRDRNYRFTLQYLEDGIKAKSFNNVRPLNKSKRMGKDADAEWIKYKFQKYITGKWEIITNETIEPLLLQFQIILLQNDLGQIDVISLTLEDPYTKYTKKVKGTDYLTYNFTSDFVEQINPNSLILERREGNIQAMQVMLFLNELNLFNGKTNAIGEIRIINSYSDKEINPSNEELLYNWALLNKYSSVKNDKFKSGQIKFLDKYHLLFQELHNVVTWAESVEFKGVEASPFKDLQTCVLEYQRTIQDPIRRNQRIKRIEEILRLLQKQDIINPSKDLATNEKRFNRVYKLALKALALEKNVNFRLQLDDHSQYFGKLSLRAILKGSISGTLIDNPGSLESELLNLTSKLTTLAYLGIRDDLADPIAKLRLLGDALVAEKKLTWWDKNIYYNYSDIFKNMYIRGPRSFDFKNPWNMDNDLTPAEREYLKYALLLINKNKKGSHYSDEYILESRHKDKDKFFQVPLKQGSTRNKADIDSFWDLLKTKIRSLTPAILYKQHLKETQGVDMSEIKEYDLTNEALNYLMTNLFSAGDGEHRTSLLEDPENVFDTNLENILIAHTFAYSQKKHIDLVFPLLKAAMFHLIEQGNNKGLNFEKDIAYFENYIKAKILGKSIVEKENLPFNRYVNYVRQAASYAALALSPVTGFGQILQGFWNSIKVTLAQSGQPDAFNFLDLRKAFILCYRDMFSTKEPTLMQLINELYALNDMDMNVHKIVESMKSDKHGILNLNRFLFKTVARPDYYNRGILFAAQMIHDGVLDPNPEVSAHYIKDGKLVYDINRDKRFSALNDKNHPDYNKLMSLYREICKLFTIENAKNPDGTLFTVPEYGKIVPLPRAYVNTQAESMKALSDMIYGYYSHEKKSLIHNMMIGGLIMQMRTYVSAKKQQYMAKGSSTLRGRFEHLKDENGKLLYYGLNEDGTPNEDILQSDTPNNFPVVRWVGLYGEGIFASLSELLDVQERSLSDNFQTLVEVLFTGTGNKDSLEFARSYNRISLWFDLGMVYIISPILMSLLADWYDELEDELKDSTVLDGIRLASGNVFRESVEYSLMDFDIWNSLYTPVLGNINPFALTYLSAIPKRLINAWASDRSDSYDALVSSFGATRLIKPFFDCIKPEWAYDQVQN